MTDQDPKTLEEAIARDYAASADQSDEALAYGFTEQADYEAALVTQRDHPELAERWDGAWAISVGIYSAARDARDRLAKKGSPR